MRIKQWRRESLQRAICQALEERRLLAADVVISEFMADNQTGQKDSFGEFSDWIELHNAGDASANLNDFYLTDSSSKLTLYRLPSQTLAAGGYTIVFASGNNLVTSGGEIHTNFGLSASGEYLALVNAADDSVQFSYSPQYPAQSSDVSYGLTNSDDPNSAQGYFSDPTPKAANIPSAVPPAFSVAGKTFTGSLQVALSTTTPNATIYYTVNGTTPTTSSSVYSTPLTITNTTMLRTIASAAGLQPSPVRSQSYIALNTSTPGTTTIGSSSVATFTSNLPIVMIDTYGTAINTADDIAASASFIDTSNGTASTLGTSDYDGRIGIRIRGSTSANYAKKQYAVKLYDENDNGTKTALFGMASDDDWVLYAPYTEKVMMQNALAYKWANQMGEYASGTQFCEVFLNTSSVTAGGVASPTAPADYLGVYILEEKIKISSNRVNVNEISPANLSGGWIVGEDRTGGQAFFLSADGVDIDYEDPDINDITASEESAISSKWNALENALKQPDFTDPNSADYYGKFINTQSFIDFYLLNEMTRNIDSFWLSTFFNYDPSTGLISMGPAWDFNLGLGAANYNYSANSDGWDTDLLSPTNKNIDNTSFPEQDVYLQRLLTSSDFKQAVVDRWDQLRSTIFTTGNLMQDIDTNVSILTDGGAYPTEANPIATNPVGRNFIRWSILGTYDTTNGFYDPNGVWDASGGGGIDGSLAPGDINLMKNWLIARVQWMDTMTWTTAANGIPTLPATGTTTEYPPEPTVTSGGSFGSSVTVSMSPLGPATDVDSNLLADGSSPPVEWFVPSATNQDAGWYLPNYTYPTSPAGAVWTPGVGGVGYDTQTSPINFLPYIGNGGTTNATNSQASAIQTAMSGKSSTIYARYTFPVTDPSAIGALILEMRYDDGFVAWINGVRVMDANSPENTNPTYNTTSDQGSSGNDTLAIDLREYDVSSVKGLLVAGTNVLAIQELNSGSGSADALIDPALVSRTYSYPTTGTVYYTTNGTDPRLAGGAISSSAIAYTGSFSLSTSTEVEARSLVNGVWGGLNTQTYQVGIDPLRITELQYDPPDNQNFEFIKVQNTGTSMLSLSGYTFTNGVTFDFTSGTLAAGASGVIVKDQPSFLSRYGNQFNILGTYTGSLDNSGESIAFANRLGTTVQNFKYSPSWYPETKGEGYSLVIRDPAGALTNWGLASGWESSLADSPPAATNTSAGVNSKFNVDVTFAQNLSATTSLGGMSLTNTTTSATISNSTITPTTSGADLLLSFSGVSNGVLPDGYYTATLPVGGVLTASGVPMDAAYSFAFFVLQGDANHDGTVNALDFNALATNFGQGAASAGKGDFDYSGTVDSNDFAILASKYGKVLSPPGASAVPESLPARSLSAKSPNLFGTDPITADTSLLDDTSL